MSTRVKFDPAKAADRRQFLLDRAYQQPTYGCGSDLSGLMDKPRINDAILPIRDDVPYMLVGAHGAAIYAPERATQSVDIVVPFEMLARMTELLLADDWNSITNLDLRGSTLGLIGWAFNKKPGFQDINVLSSTAPWLNAAFEAAPVLNSFFKRVMPLQYLVLMMIDSARALDQADLSRMLGQLNKAEVEEVVHVIELTYGGSAFSKDIRQYAEIGRWE
jgi:hypothetical protein